MDNMLHTGIVQGISVSIYLVKYRNYQKLSTESSFEPLGSLKGQAIFVIKNNKDNGNIIYIFLLKARHTLPVPPLSSNPRHNLNTCMFMCFENKRYLGFNTVINNSYKDVCMQILSGKT